MWQARLDLKQGSCGHFCKHSPEASSRVPFVQTYSFTDVLWLQTILASLVLPGAPSAGMFQRNSSRKRRLQAKLAAVEVRRGAGASLHSSAYFNRLRHCGHC